MHTRATPTAPDLDLAAIAAATPLFSGAGVLSLRVLLHLMLFPRPLPPFHVHTHRQDLENLCREAALIALRRDISSPCVTPPDMAAALAAVRPSLTAAGISWFEDFESSRA